MDTVMVVDDDPAVREIFTTYLEMNGYQVLEADGGPACLELLKTHNPDIILLDMMMEPMDGWETLVAIRHNPPSVHIPVMIITGKQPVPEEILTYGGLLADFIVKPIDFKRVVASLPHVLEINRDLVRETERITREGGDPDLAEEYARLLRLARVAHNLNSRIRSRVWAEQIPLRNQQERLQWLHKTLGFPDHFLEWGRERDPLQNDTCSNILG
jgi:two-component system, OmpR family, response regulator